MSIMTNCHFKNLNIKELTIKVIVLSAKKLIDKYTFVKRF
jgi:hypothetical protein